jgi:hypothetical protein
VRLVGIDLRQDEARIQGAADVVAQVLRDPVQHIATVEPRIAFGREVGAGRRQRREAGVVAQVQARQVGLTRVWLFDGRELGVVVAGREGDARIADERAAREGAGDCAAGLAVEIGVHVSQLCVEAVRGLPQQARAAGERLLLVPVLLAVVHAGAVRIRRIDAHGDATVVEPHEPMCIDESRLVIVVAGNAQSERFSHRQVDRRRCRVARIARFIDHAQPYVGVAGKLAELRRGGDDSQRTAERASAVESTLRSAQHFDAFDVIELEVAIDGRVADVGADRRLLERAKAARARTRVEPADDRKRGRAVARAAVSQADARHLPRERREIGGAGVRQLRRAHHRDGVRDFFGRLRSAAGRYHNFLQSLQPCIGLSLRARSLRDPVESYQHGCADRRARGRETVTHHHRIPLVLVVPLRRQRNCSSRRPLRFATRSRGILGTDNSQPVAKRSNGRHKRRLFAGADARYSVGSTDRT